MKLARLRSVWQTARREFARLKQAHWQEGAAGAARTVTEGAAEVAGLARTARAAKEAGAGLELEAAEAEAGRGRAAEAARAAGEARASWGE
jgi:hypothetical protein